MDSPVSIYVASFFLKSSTSLEISLGTATSFWLLTNLTGLELEHGICRLSLKVSSDPRRRRLWSSQAGTPASNSKFTPESSKLKVALSPRKSLGF